MERIKTIILIALLSVTPLVFATDKLIDYKLAAKAEIVLRIKLIALDNADKYAWYQVQVLQVLKNESDTKITDTLSVAAYSWKDGVPKGESTIYLEPYNKTEMGLWKLVGGEASTGVSHNIK